MRRALIALTLVASTSPGMLSCGEERPYRRAQAACVSGTYWGRRDTATTSACTPAARASPATSAAAAGVTVAGTILEFNEENECNGNAGPAESRNEVEVTDASKASRSTSSPAAPGTSTPHASSSRCARVRVLGANGRVSEMGSAPPTATATPCHTRTARARRQPRAWRPDASCCSRYSRRQLAGVREPSAGAGNAQSSRFLSSPLTASKKPSAAPEVITAPATCTPVPASSMKAPASHRGLARDRAPRAPCEGLAAVSARGGVER